MGALQHQISWAEPGRTHQGSLHLGLSNKGLMTSSNYLIGEGKPTWLLDLTPFTNTGRFSAQLAKQVCH